MSKHKKIGACAVVGASALAGMTVFADVPWSMTGSTNRVSVATSSSANASPLRVAVSHPPVVSATSITMSCQQGTTIIVK